MDAFLKQLAEPRPDPGGGAAAAYAGLVAAALILKVTKIESNRKIAVAKVDWNNLISLTKDLIKDLEDLIPADINAYHNFIQAKKLTATSIKPELFMKLIDVPLSIADRLIMLLSVIQDAAGNCAKLLVSDVEVGYELAGASAKGALAIARANLEFDYVDNKQQTERIRMMQEALDSKMGQCRKVLDYRCAK